jgi:transcriptional regulator with XRE-family HTH domain
MKMMAIIGGMNNGTLPDSPARRISLRMWQLGLKQVDVANALGYSRSFVSAIVNGEKQTRWDDTAKLARILHTTVDYILCLTDNPEIPTDQEPAPFYTHEESDALAKLADEQPDWMRRMLLDGARAQVASIKQGTTPAQDEAQLRELFKLAVLIFGKDEAHRIVDDTGRQLQPVRVGVNSYRQIALGKL